MGPHTQKEAIVFQTIHFQLLIRQFQGRVRLPIPGVVVNPFRYGQTNAFKKWGVALTSK